MSIRFKKYVNITSGVGGGNNVATREFIGRIFSTNPLIDPASVLEFTSAADVGTFFGTSSVEYARAVKYFNYVSPNIRKPQKLSFARWCYAAAPASIYGADTSFTLATLQAITAGLLTFNFAGTSVAITAIDLSTAVSLTTVASVLQTKLRLNADAHLTTCTVAYDAVNSRFTFIASNSSVVTGTFSLTQAGTGGTDLGAALGWYVSGGALNLSSAPANEPVDAVTASVGISNNFGSFCFTETHVPTLLQITAVATYNAALNVMFQYQVKVLPANYVSWSAALITIAGIGLTYELTALNEYPEMIPMSIQAATDYTQRNGVVNYMYRQVAATTASVTDDTTSDALDAARVNYYGQTQTAGQILQFYQTGVLCGLAVDPQAMNIYANEQWFKDYAGAQLMALQLSIGQLSANAKGRGQILTVLQAAVGSALFNGTIAPGKTLTPVQQLYITEQTGDNLAWLQVQKTGFWLDCVIVSAVVNGLTVYKAEYTLIYSKNDSIRSIDGSHVLI